MEEKFLDYKLLKSDMNDIVGKFTPRVPYIGLVYDAVIVVNHVFRSEARRKENGVLKHENTEP